MNMHRCWLPLAVTLLLPALSWAEPDGGAKKKKSDRDPAGVDLNDAPDVAVKKFTVAPGLQVDLWASEPLLANPVAFSMDERGRAFVVETYRRRSSAPDIRKNMDWLLPNLALRTAEERLAFLKQQNPEQPPGKVDKDHPDINGDGQFDWRDLAIESERIKLVTDANGDGVADTSSVFAEGFNTLHTGVAAGVLARGNDVWFACIPNLWHLSGDGPTATKKEPVLQGFGVHVAYSGHDMHGVKMGPDGRVYWTIADTGAHVQTKEGATVNVPDEGALFRANPDGTGLELFARGLRNPQSLAFNDVGDLFTGDNNADGGDKARWEHVVEGADFGWRIGWQFLPKLGAWNSEKLWELNAGETAFSQLPPVGHIGHGPAGIAYYPGTGLPAQYRGHFFYVDFPGGVRAFEIQPKGASYRLENPNEVLLDNTAQQMTGKLLWGLYPSDIQFGVDGGAYVLDWVMGWEKTGKGRIFRVHDPVTDASKVVHQTKARLATDLSKLPEAELLHWLDDPDQRVRMAAQFALAGRGEASATGLLKIAGSAVTKNATDRHSAHPVSRLHAIWGLGQIARTVPKTYAMLAALLGEAEPEVRAQAAKLLGESKQPAQAARLIPMLQDSEPRVRFFAAQALGKLRAAEAVEPLVSLLRDRTDGDAYLRQAASLALSQCADLPALTQLMRDPSDSVRAGVLLAMRWQGRAEVATFLQDWQPQLALEAARAIHDTPIPEALPALAQWTAQPNLPEPLALRVVNAAYQLGTPPQAEALATWAVDPKTSATIRANAVEALGQWNTTLGRDRVLGVWTPNAAKRTASGAEAAAEKVVGKLLADTAPEVREAAAEMAGSLRLKSAEPGLLQLAQDNSASAEARVTALQSLAALESPSLAAAIKATLTSTDKKLVLEARKLAVKLSPNDALQQATVALESGSTTEKQAALQTLGSLPDHEADKLLARWLDRLTAGKVPAAVKLELLEAAELRQDARVKEKLAAIQGSLQNAEDPLVKWQMALEGGDAKLGRQIFAEKAEAACMRCHKVKGEGGDVGPDLAGLGAKHDRAYLLTAIVKPNATIAPGFENLLLTLKDGNVVVGLSSSEDAENVVLTPLTGGEKLRVAKANIAQRAVVPSPMPEGLAEVLGRRDLRNLVEYLSSLR